MTKQKQIVRFGKKFLVCVLMVCTLASAILPLTASAATRSSGTRTQTITVVTKANWCIPGSESITLKQEKGVCSCRNIFTGKTKTSKVYGCWDIVAKSTDGTHTVTKELNGGSVKIPLTPNKTYKITITWDDNETFFKTAGKGSFTSYPTWRVDSTWKVSSYY